MDPGRGNIHRLANANPAHTQAHRTLITGQPPDLSEEALNAAAREAKEADRRQQGGPSDDDDPSDMEDDGGGGYETNDEEAPAFETQTFEEDLREQRPAKRPKRTAQRDNIPNASM